MSKNLEALIKKFDHHVEIVGKAVSNFPLEDREAYASWLAQTYFFVKHSTRLLTIAASNAPISDRAQHYDMIHHLKGELNHDEVARRDLEVLGYKPHDFNELPETAMLYQSQYFWLDRAEVSSMMGYALLLEGLASKYGKIMLDKVKHHPPKATTFVKLHCEVDVVHYAEGLKSLEQYREDEYENIVKNLEQSSYMYCRMLESALQGNAMVGSKKKSA